MAEKIYECQNEACPLGIPGEAGGLFTGGMTDQNRRVLGLPDDHKIGDGVCPNCGQKGKAV